VTFAFGDHELDIERRELRHGGVPVAIEPQVFDLLVHLIRNRDRVVSKDDLIETIWGGRIVSESAVTTRLNAARKAVGDTGAAQRLIRTVPRKGVRFVGEVIERTAPVAAERAVASQALALPDKPSIAVLPFANLSNDPEQEYLVDGIVEDIITALSRYPSLFVIARNSTFTYKGRPVNVNEVGRDLGVRYVLEGSLRKSGNRIRVTAQLVEAGTGNHLWAKRYDRDLADIFAVQDEITEAVTIAIAPAIAGAELHRAMRKPPESLDAWAAYQRGLWHLGQCTANDNGLAEGFFRQAMLFDPDFAGAHSGLAWALVFASATFQSQLQAETLRSAVAFARRAVALDGADAEARACLSGALLLGHGDYDGARAEAERALEISPNLASAHGELGRTLIFSGWPKQGLASVETSIRLDPRHPLLGLRLNQLACGFYLCRDYEAAIEAARRAVRDFPKQPLPYRWLASSLGQLGRVEEAKQVLDHLFALAPDFVGYWIHRRVAWHRPEDHVHMVEGLQKAGWDGPFVTTR